VEKNVELFDFDEYLDLLKARPHKYISKKRVGTDWQYKYREPEVVREGMADYLKPEHAKDFEAYEKLKKLKGMLNEAGEKKLAELEKKFGTAGVIAGVKPIIKWEEKEKKVLPAKGEKIKSKGQKALDKILEKKPKSIASEIDLGKYFASGMLKEAEYKALGESQGAKKIAILKWGLNQYKERYVEKKNAPAGIWGDPEFMVMNKAIGAQEGVRRAMISRAGRYDEGTKEQRQQYRIALNIQQRMPKWPEKWAEFNKAEDYEIELFDINGLYKAGMGGVKEIGPKDPKPRVKTGLKDVKFSKKDKKSKGVK
jgi:hypothetical protein